MAIAPRLGISHPITMKSKMYFNYGHYYQSPSFQYFYRGATSNPATNPQIGNPNLDYEKTVSYEVGVNTEFTEDWVVDVAGYYRDVYNQIGTVEQTVGPLKLNRFFNLGYARARGFEFTLDKKFSNMWALTVNYTFSYALGKESAATEGLTQRTTTTIPENRDEHPLDWDERHTIHTFLTMDVDKSEKPRPFGIWIPSDWLLTLQMSYGSGTPYTPSTWTKFGTGDGASLILPNSARFPSTLTSELKFDKFWDLSKKIRIATGFEVYNLFNRKNVRNLYAATGNSYDSVNILDTSNSRSSNGGNGLDVDHNPANFGAPRQILLHFKLMV
jgi:outer membrane receptor protein involved in Fe transport